MNKAVQKVFLICFSFFIVFPISAQKDLRVLEYNVENLFDTIPEDGRDDKAFLPLGEKRWNNYRYWRKIGGLCKVIAGVGGLTPPELIALCEVENGDILNDLTQKTALKRWKYKYIITHSPDRRGIDVALLYQPNSFKVISKKSERIPYNINKEFPTRDILHVTGEVLTGDTLDLFVCHFPSRAGGKSQTEKYRCRVAQVLLQKVDSILNIRCRPATLILGDFNDEYTDRSIAEVLQAQCSKTIKEIDDKKLYLLSSNKSLKNGIKGTYKYNGFWSQLDHIIVNGQLLRIDNCIQTSWQDCQIVDFPFLLKEDVYHGGFKPWSTYLGNYYNGGISDHLPLLIQLKLNYK
jgi:endonuclease/exonuclease/phosphatase family metal-dependent hydrolase